MAGKRQSDRHKLTVLLAPRQILSLFNTHSCLFIQFSSVAQPRVGTRHQAPEILTSSSQPVLKKQLRSVGRIHSGQSPFAQEEITLNIHHVYLCH